MRYALSIVLFTAVAWSWPLPASQVIANWDVVPFRCIDKPLKIGVVAFHETGADVVIEVNGEKLARLEDPTLNDRTHVWEYWTTLDPADYRDGPLTLTATALPDGDGHEPRELRECILYANSGGTLTHANVVWADAAAGDDKNGDGSEGAPFATIAKAVKAAGDGGTVYLKAGDYKLKSLGRARKKRWTTVAAAPGLGTKDVRILTYGKDKSSTGRYGRSHVRWHRVSLYCDRAHTRWGSVFYFERGTHTWFDGVEIYDANGRFGGSVPFNGRGAHTYLTGDTLIRDLSNGASGFQRNVRFESICSDIYRAHSGLTALNVRIRHMHRGETKAHPDFFQLYSPKSIPENIIVANVRATDMLAQGIFGGPKGIRDVAFVNILLEKDPPKSYLMSQISGQWEHALLWHATIVDQSFFFRQTKHIKGFDVRNCVIHNIKWRQRENSGITIVATHAVRGKKFGAQATGGDPLYADPAGDDYRLRPESPAWQTGVPIPGVPADIDGNPYDEKTPNRGAFAASAADEDTVD